jgi:hypothetical protein
MDNYFALRKKLDSTFCTTDNSLPFQQNLEGRKLAVVVLNKNRWNLIRRALPQIAAAIAGAKFGSCTIVEIPET